MKFWCDNSKETALLCKSMFPEDVKETIEQAERICLNTFMFRDHWEMERTNIPVIFNEKIDWAYIPEDDPEWLYAMNRHTSILNLCKAWLYTDQIKYAQKAIELMKDWIRNVKLTSTSETNTWRSLEAGIRCENWIRSLQLLQDCDEADEAFKAEVQNSLKEHALYLVRTSDDFHKLSNWGILQDHGLLIAGLFLKEEEYVSIALKRLEYQAHMQIMEDGSHWEQSPMYHCEVLHCLMDSFYLATINNIKISKSLKVKIHKMCTALACWIKPNRKLFCQSDSDNVDGGNLLAQGAILFQDGKLKAAAREELFIENLWDHGKEAINKYKEIKTVWPKLASTVLADSGNYILRSDNTPNAAYLHMHCGGLGSGHGHADLLHVDIGAYQEDILIDSGRYTYVNTSLRRELKEPAAHNLVRVDNEDFSVCLDSWGYEKLAVPIKGEYRLKAKVDYINGFHMGYCSLAEGVLSQRQVIYIKPNIFILFDSFYTKGHHTYEQYFHFNKGALSKENENSYTWTGEKASARLMTIPDERNGSIGEYSYSEEYNLLEEGKVLTFSKEETGFLSMVTVIVTGKANELQNSSIQRIPIALKRSGKILQPSEAEAVKIYIDKKEYIAAVVYEELISEVDFFVVDQKEFYGKVAVFLPNTKRGIGLVW